MLDIKIPEPNLKSPELELKVKTDPRAELLEKLRRIEEEYYSSKSDKEQIKEPDLQKMSVDSLTDDEIKTLAESGLRDYYLKSLVAVDEQYAAARADAEAQKTRLGSDAVKTGAKIEEVYGQAKAAAANDVLKRGLARSSVAALTQNGLEDSKSKELAELARASSDAARAVDTEISGLETKKQNALNNFDIAYAAKLVGEINALKEERADREREALEYNNKLEQYLAEYSLDKLKTESQLDKDAAELALKNNELRKLNNNEAEGKKYLLIDAYLAALSKDEAKKQLNEFSTVVSAAYFDKLWTKYGK